MEETPIVYGNIAYNSTLLQRSGAVWTVKKNLLTIL